MTSHLVLHIGTHKTGSTAIQDSFWKNAPKLAKNGLIYPRLSYRHTGHHGLIAEQVGLPDVYLLANGGAAALKNLVQKYDRQDVTLFLSSEEFSRLENGRTVNFARLRETIDGFDKITIVCFVRPQWRFLQSIYLEISKNRSPPRPPDLVKEALESGCCQGLCLDYQKLLDQVEVYFDPKDIVFIDYEAVSSASGGSPAAVLNAIGFSGVLSEDRLQRSNPSPSALAQWAANLLAEPYAASARQRRAVLDSLPKSGCILTRCEIRGLRAHFEQSNASLRERRQPFQPNFALTDQGPPKNYVHREDISIEHWLNIARQFARLVG